MLLMKQIAHTACSVLVCCYTDRSIMGVSLGDEPHNVHDTEFIPPASFSSS